MFKRIFGFLAAFAVLLFSGAVAVAAAPSGYVSSEPLSPASVSFPSSNSFSKSFVWPSYSVSDSDLKLYTFSGNFTFFVSGSPDEAFYHFDVYVYDGYRNRIDSFDLDLSSVTYVFKSDSYPFDFIRRIVVTPSSDESTGIGVRYSSDLIFYSWDKDFSVSSESSVFTDTTVSSESVTSPVTDVSSVNPIFSGLTSFIPNIFGSISHIWESSSGSIIFIFVFILPLISLVVWLICKIIHNHRGREP